MQLFEYVVSFVVFVGTQFIQFYCIITSPMNDEFYTTFQVSNSKPSN